MATRRQSKQAHRLQQYRTTVAQIIKQTATITSHSPRYVPLRRARRVRYRAHGVASIQCDRGTSTRVATTSVERYTKMTKLVVRMIGATQSQIENYDTTVRFIFQNNNDKSLISLPLNVRW